MLWIVSIFQWEFFMVGINLTTGLQPLLGIPEGIHRVDVLSFFNSREVFILKLPIQAALSKIILHSSLSWDEDDEQQHRLTAPPSCVTACVTVSIQPIHLHLLLLLMSNY